MSVDFISLFFAKLLVALVCVRVAVASYVAASSPLLLLLCCCCFFGHAVLSLFVVAAVAVVVRSLLMPAHVNDDVEQPKGKAEEGSRLSCVRKEREKKPEKP